MTAKTFLFLILFIFVFSGLRSQNIRPEYKKQVEALVKKPTIQKAFDYILKIEPETIEDMITLTEIPSPTFQELEEEWSLPIC